MKNIRLFALVTIATSAMACSSNGKNAVVIPQEQSLKGDLKDYYLVVDKQYTIVKNEGTFSNNMITVELKRTDEDLPFGQPQIVGYARTPDNNDDYYEVGFGIELLDESGNVVIKKGATETGMSGVYSPDDVVEMASMAPGDQGSIRWSFQEDKLKNVTSFRVLSVYKLTSGSGGSSASDDSSTSAVTTTSANNWDSVIDDYEEFIDKYIVLLKKAKAGDMDAVSEYATILTKAQEIQGKLSNAQSSLSTSQVARFTKIMTKMASVASSM